MRVVEVVYNWPVETFIQRHIKALLALNLPVQVIARHNLASADKASLVLENEDVNIPIKVMPNFNHLGLGGKLGQLRYLTKKSIMCGTSKLLSEKVLLGYFEGLRPELIHFHDATLAATMGWISNRLGVPYTLSLRGSDIQVFPLQTSSQRDAILAAIEGAAGVHVVCNALGLLAEKWIGRDLKYSVIYTTVPIPPTLSTWQGVAANESIHFVTSGRLMWRKGFDDLFVALRRLKDIGLDARLTLVGVGPDLDYLLYLIDMLKLESAVTLLGKLPYKKIQKLFLSAHAYIQSSVAEGLSNSLVEAIVNGLPVFATDVGGTREVIENGVTGFLLPPLQPHEWGKTLLQVQDSIIMEKLRTAAYYKATRLFATETHASSFVAFYENVITSNRTNLR